MTRATTFHTSRPFRVLMTSAYFEPGFRAGGPIRSVARIVDTISDAIELTVVTGDRDFRAERPYSGLSGTWVDRARSRVFYLNVRSVPQWLHVLRELRAAPIDLLYVNSLWAPAFTVIPVLAARLGLIKPAQVLVAPRGELSPGALSLKARKKRFFLRGWGRLLRSMKVTWHATADLEADEIRAVFPWASVQINPNQTMLPDEPLPVATKHAGSARLVFISRISPKKNLDVALRALRDVTAPVDFDIYGPLEDAAYWARCQSLIQDLPGNVRVQYRGELSHAEVRPTFSRYDAFVFPTRGENFGHVIAESLSAACPVICPDNTPWTQVLDDGGGRAIRRITVQRLGLELHDIAVSTPDHRQDRRRRAAEAYRSWRKQTDGTNILELTRSATEIVLR
jgi:glycosyltransferase involved in cell wall biosynthesis